MFGWAWEITLINALPFWGGILEGCVGADTTGGSTAESVEAAWAITAGLDAFSGWRSADAGLESKWVGKGKRWMQPLACLPQAGCPAPTLKVAFMMINWMRYANRPAISPHLRY